LITNLYIGSDLIEQYKDESVEVVSSVLDITDITKNTGDYTKTFTVPASKSNNKLFKHYYDATIDNSFDARTKIDGHIELDGLPFKIGKWRLSKVSVKKNKPDSYTINFFGNLVSLKDTLGKDELTSLDLSAFDHDYTAANIENGLKVGGLSAGDIIYNLLAKKRYYYNDDVTDNTQEDTIANIAFGGGDDAGVFIGDLKPSIRVIKIIEAIEDKYTVANGYENPIVFSRDFFETSEFTELFMWLNSDKDRLHGETQRADFTAGDTANVDLPTDTGTFTIEAGSRWDFEIIVSNQFLFNPEEITLSMFVDGIKTQEITGNVVGGILSFYLVMNSTLTSNELVTKEVYFELTGLDAGVNISWNQKKYSSANVLLGEWMTTGENSLGNEFVVSDNFPKLKVMDFLKGLFNMFKLVIVPQDNGTLYVDTLKSYYSLGNTYDVTKYVDFETVEVSRGEILNKIDLKFSEPTTILNIQFEKNNRRGYGDEEITLKDDNGKILDGETLEFELPFEQIVYERLTDQASGDLTGIQYGAIIDEDLEPANPKAHIFYNAIATTVNSRIGFQTGAGKIQLDALINTPYHHFGATLPSYSTTFKNEFSTWDGVSLNNNLYSLHYKDYVEAIFNIKKRNFNYKAQLPIHIITKLELNDTLKIKGNYYRIDKYSYNLLTSETKLNLINNFEENIGVPESLQDTVYTDFIAKTETVQVKNLQESSLSKVDTGFGTSWITLTTNNNNVSLAFDEFSTTKGDVRSMKIVSSIASASTTIYAYQTDKGTKPLTFDIDDIKFDSDLITWDQNLI